MHEVHNAPVMHTRPILENVLGSQKCIELCIITWYYIIDLYILCDIIFYLLLYILQINVCIQRSKWLWNRVGVYLLANIKQSPQCV